MFCIGHQSEDDVGDDIINRRQTVSIVFYFRRKKKSHADIREQNRWVHSSGSEQEVVLVCQ